MSISYPDPERENLTSDEIGHPAGGRGHGDVHCTVLVWLS